MFQILHFLWIATRGHRFRPWRSPYLRWRIETYSGTKMNDVDFASFWSFVWHERGELVRFLKWAARMERVAQGKTIPSFD